ncbi:hypothetical protein QBC41DRAFT_392698 [Cercophora samala]|uniref:Uncharacterized protein n=1 Tax=Cercophora samala TaxID=330535 RepID=A0AA39ZEG8_9PEZI|nr:hypothetical protein QBC41DRAFT_392698 [Cercophora samala]
MFLRDAFLLLCPSSLALAGVTTSWESKSSQQRGDLARRWTPRNYVSNAQIPHPPPSLLKDRPAPPIVRHYHTRADYMTAGIELLSSFTCKLQATLETHINGVPSYCFPKVHQAVSPTSEEDDSIQYFDSRYPLAIDNLVQKGLFPKVLSPYLKQGPLALQAVLSLPREDLFEIGYLIANETNNNNNNACPNMICQNGPFNPQTSSSSSSSSSSRPVPTLVKQHISRFDAWSSSRKATATATAAATNTKATLTAPLTTRTVILTNSQGDATTTTRTTTQTTTTPTTPTPDHIVLQEQDKADILEALSSAMPRLFDQLFAPSPTAITTTTTTTTATEKTRVIPASELQRTVVETSIPGPWIGGGNVTVRFYEAGLVAGLIVGGDHGGDKVNGAVGNAVGKGGGVWGRLMVVIIGMVVLL